MAVGWKPEMHDELVPFMEDCKRNQTLGIELDRLCGRFKPSNPDAWSYLGWDFVMSPSFLEGHDVVDRWNDSQAWLELPRAQGGLEIKPNEIHRFNDSQRHSAHFFDAVDTEDLTPQSWIERVNVPDLLLPPFRDKKLLHFGSLYGMYRLNMAREESVQLKERIASSMILEENLLTEISEEIRERLGSFIGVHLRIGDGAFMVSAGCRSASCTTRSHC